MFKVTCKVLCLNPTKFYLWKRTPERWEIVKTFTYDTRATGELKTDEELYLLLIDFYKGYDISNITVANDNLSFKECLLRHQIKEKI